MWSSQAGGIEGHHWRLYRTSGTPCPAASCASAAGPRPPDTTPPFSLELKGHLEDSLHNGARLIRGDDQPSAELPNTHSS